MSGSFGARRASAASTFLMVGVTKRRNDEFVLLAIDEDEAPGVLQLALHGDEIELAERASRLSFAGEARGLGVLGEARLDERRDRTPGSCR